MKKKVKDIDYVTLPNILTKFMTSIIQDIGSIKLTT